MKLIRYAILGIMCSLAILFAPGCSELGSTNDKAPSVEQAPTASEHGEAAPAEAVTVNAAALKGPTAMGMAGFMQAAEDGSAADNEYRFSVHASADEITPRLVRGDLDIAAVPANLASVLWNNTDGGVRVLAVNTLGVLYVCEAGDTVQSVADLVGKTLYASGKGSTPEYALDYILEGNGIDPEADVTIEWKSEHAECVAALTSDPDGIALLPQPFVTTAQMQNDAIRVALDLTEEWDRLQAESDAPSSLITGVLVARAAFVEEQPEAVREFLKHYRDSVAWTNENEADAAQLIERFDIANAAVAEQALPACRIVYLDGTEMEARLSGYLGVLYQANPNSVGGALPADDFYYPGLQGSSDANARNTA